MCTFFTSLLADVSLTTPLSLSPAAPVNMAGPSSSTFKELQEQLNELNKLAFQELRKGAGHDKDLVVRYERRVDSLVAQLDRQTAGEVQHHGSVLCCRAPFASGSTSLISMHTPAIVGRASWEP